jgi:lipid-binding SYLF domain-containing protein
MNRLTTVICLVVMLTMTGCAAKNVNTRNDKRQAILNMKNEVLANLYTIKPDVKAQIETAPGYAVFSNANIKVFVASFGGGYGVVKNNLSGEHTYMRMGELGVGLGLGIKDFRGVFVFHNPEAMYRFIEQGWIFGAQADATAKAGKNGAALSGEITSDQITIYQLTEVGLALQATLKGTKFWKADSLN